MQEALRMAWKVHDLEGFLARFLGTDAFVDQLRPGRDLYVPNTDDRNFLEYGFAKTVGMATGFLRRDAARGGDVTRVSIVRRFAGGEIDWDLVEKRRTEFNWQFNGSLETLRRKRRPSSGRRMAGYIYFRELQVPQSAR